jgi:pilus assembly protein CpaC
MYFEFQEFVLINPTLRPKWVVGLMVMALSAMSWAQTTVSPVGSTRAAPTASPTAPVTAPPAPPSSISQPANAAVPEVGSVGSSVLEMRREVAPPPLVQSRKASRIESGIGRTLAVGDVSTIGLSGLARIAVGNGSLVKATVVDDNQIVLLAEAVGDTVMHVWLKNGRQIAFNLHVQAQRPDRLVTDLRDYIEDIPTLSLRTVGDRVVLEGQYPDAATKTRIKALTDSFPQVLNLANEKALDVDPLLLERMVQLDLRVIEVKKSALHRLGIKWNETSSGPTFATNILGYANTPWRPDTTGGFPPVNTANPAATYLGLATRITSALNFLEEKGDAWTLAEPRLSCKSGGESKFIAGGEVPIPVAQGFGNVSVEYKKYGVLIEFKPQADRNGNIASSILVEVSEPDTRNASKGFLAFTTNRAETEVSVKEGEPFVIAGLLRQRAEKSSDAVPGLGKIPLLSYLFGVREVRSEQTELLLVVLPKIVTPQSASVQDSVNRAQVLTDQARRKTAEQVRVSPSQSLLSPPAPASAASAVVLPASAAASGVTDSTAAEVPPAPADTGAPESSPDNFRR